MYFTFLLHVEAPHAKRGQRWEIIKNRLKLSKIVGKGLKNFRKFSKSPCNSVLLTSILDRYIALNLSFRHNWFKYYALTVISSIFPIQHIVYISLQLYYNRINIIYRLFVKTRLIQRRWNKIDNKDLLCKLYICTG